MLRRVLLLVFSFALVSIPARADAIYDFTVSASGVSSHWRFSVPDLLTTTTTVLASDLLLATTNNATPITSVQIFNPFSLDPTVLTSFAGPGVIGISDFGFDAVAPFDHFGTFTSLAGSVLTISPAPSVPEPSMAMLVITALAAAGWQLKRQTAPSRT